MELKPNYSPKWSNLSCDLNWTLWLECVLSDGNYVFSITFYFMSESKNHPARTDAYFGV